MRIVYKENILKPIVFIIAALLFNAIVPTLAHAAILLHGSRVNANTLVRDAYVHVTYGDRSGEQKVVKGWIDTIGDSTFTIRSGGTKNRTVIAYDSVIAVIMSDESTVPVKQMNDVNRFLQQSPVVAYLQGSRVNANTLVRDAYVQVTYSDRSGKQKVVKGWVGVIDDSTFTIGSRDIRNRTVIAYDNVISLVTVIAKPTPIVTPASGITHLIGMMDPSGRITIKAAGGFVVGIPLARLGLDTGSSYSKKLIGFMAGYTLGVAVGVSMLDPYDQFTSSFVGSFIGASAGMGLIPVDVGLAAMAVVIFPITGAVIGSELSRRPPEASYFSVGLAPDRDGNLSAVATLRF